jgi:hypothetical protein
MSATGKLLCIRFSLVVACDDPNEKGYFAKSPCHAIASLFPSGHCLCSSHSIAQRNSRAGVASCSCSTLKLHSVHRSTSDLESHKNYRVSPSKVHIEIGDEPCCPWPLVWLGAVVSGSGPTKQPSQVEG